MLIILISAFETNQKLSFNLHYFLKHSFSDYNRRQRNYYQAFYYLLRYKFLEKKLIQNVESFTITKKGKYKALKYIIKNKPQKKWDGKLRLIIFDIPEEIAYKRQRFRENLQLLGFKYLQKSAWLCPYDIRKELGIIVDYLNIREYVEFMVIEKLEDDERIKKLFNLN